MKRNHLSLLAGSCVVGILTVAMADITAFQIVRVVLGLLLAFIVPGFVLVSAVLPERQFSLGEYLLASVGASLAMSTTAAVALGAAPIGLSRLSFSVVLGSCTLILSIIAALRAHVHNDPRRNNVDRPNGIES
jgi:uncharacterized membrane protein